MTTEGEVLWRRGHWEAGIGYSKDGQAESLAIPNVRAARSEDKGDQNNDQNDKQNGSETDVHIRLLNFLAEFTLLIYLVEPLVKLRRRQRRRTPLGRSRRIGVPVRARFAR
jgi:flagellar biosynthesis/type III secretory pathway M-ring protein FliF/YscJ